MEATFIFIFALFNFSKMVNSKGKQPLLLMTAITFIFALFTSRCTSNGTVGGCRQEGASSTLIIHLHKMICYTFRGSDCFFHFFILLFSGE